MTGEFPRIERAKFVTHSPAIQYDLDAVTKKINHWDLPSKDGGEKRRIKSESLPCHLAGLKIERKQRKIDRAETTGYASSAIEKVSNEKRNWLDIDLEQYFC